MRHPAFVAASALLLCVATPRPAAAYQLPNGDTVWNLTADYYGTIYDLRMEVPSGSVLGSLALTNRDTGETQVLDLNPAVVVNRDAGQADEMIAEVPGFPVSPPVLGLYQLDIHLVDVDGLAFDGAIPTMPGGGYSFLPVDPPPLSMFEMATVAVIYNVENPNVPGDVRSISLTWQITALPEPGAGLLILPIAAAALLRSRRSAR